LNIDFNSLIQVIHNNLLIVNKQIKDKRKAKQGIGDLVNKRKQIDKLLSYAKVSRDKNNLENIKAIYETYIDLC
jgi:hypothetical protein